MKKAEYRAWLRKNKVYSSEKQESDSASRVKRVEKAFASSVAGFKSIEDEFAKDGGASMRKLLSRRGVNEEMNKHPVTDLPLGSPQMDSIVSALRKYLIFLSETENG